MRGGVAAAETRREPADSHEASLRRHTSRCALRLFTTEDTYSHSIDLLRISIFIFVFYFTLEGRLNPNGACMVRATQQGTSSIGGPGFRKDRPKHLANDDFYYDSEDYYESSTTTDSSILLDFNIFDNTIKIAKINDLYLYNGYNLVENNLDVSDIRLQILLLDNSLRNFVTTRVDGFSQIRGKLKEYYLSETIADFSEAAAICLRKGFHVETFLQWKKDDLNIFRTTVFSDRVIVNENSGEIGRAHV